MLDKSCSIFTVSTEQSLCSCCYSSGEAPGSLAKILVDFPKFVTQEKYIQTISYNLIELAL